MGLALAPVDLVHTVRWPRSTWCTLYCVSSDPGEQKSDEPAGDRDSADECRDGTPRESDEPAQVRTAKGRDPRDLTVEERQFLRRYAEDRPPHYDTNWG